jgi:hypothetical protein
MIVLLITIINSVLSFPAAKGSYLNKEKPGLKPGFSNPEKIHKRKGRKEQ